MLAFIDLWAYLQKFTIGVDKKISMVYSESVRWSVKWTLNNKGGYSNVNN